MRIAAVVAFSLLAGATAAVAQMPIREVPNDAQQGYLTYIHGNLVILDGRETRLAPGGLIRGQNNLIVMPASLPRDSMRVRYRLDQNGELASVWILTPEEAAESDRRAPHTLPAPAPSK
jgi:hypothetical protein